MKPELVIFLIWFSFTLYAIKEISWAVESKREIKRRHARFQARFEALEKELK